MTRAINGKKIIIGGSRMVRFFYDLETTGLNVFEHGVHQIAALIEVDGEIVEKLDIKVQPNPNRKITEEALKVGGVTLEQVQAYQTMKRAYKQLIMTLSKYVDRYNRKDKMFLIGFNNRNFDDNFFRAWFLDNDDPYFGSWFWSAGQDVMVLAAQYLEKRVPNMPNFKLKSVAAELGISVEEEKLHDAFYDVWLTYQIHRIVTGVDFEL